MAGRPAVPDARSKVTARKERALAAANRSLAETGSSQTAARAVQAVRSARRGGKSREGESGPRTVSGPMLALTCLGNILGTLVFILCVAVFWGSGEMVQVLKGICTDEFAASSERIALYQDFFTKLGKGSYKVTSSKPDILGGEINYAWSVQVPGSSEVRAFCWKHDVQENVILPMGNPALCLDLELELITLPEARQYGFYDPDDRVTQAIVQDNFELLKPVDLAGPPTPGVPEAPIGAPVRTPEEANQRAASAQAKSDAAAGKDDEGSAEEPGQATEVDTGGGEGDGGDSGSGEGAGQEVRDPGQY